MYMVVARFYPLMTTDRHIFWTKFCLSIFIGCSPTCLTSQPAYLMTIVQSKLARPSFISLAAQCADTYMRSENLGDTGGHAPPTKRVDLEVVEGLSQRPGGKPGRSDVDRRQKAPSSPTPCP